jgi:hypothetical protein
MNEYLPYKLYFLYSIKTNYTSVVIVRALAEKARRTFPQGKLAGQSNMMIHVVLLSWEKIGKNYLCSRKPFLSHDLMMPKCEIFDSSAFHYFYTIKPFWVDDFVVKILTYYFNFLRIQASFIVSDAQAGHMHKELMRMLSMRISSLCTCSVHASVPVPAQHGLKAFFKFGIFTLMLSMRVRNWVHSAWASVPDSYAQWKHQFLMHMLGMFWRDWPPHN